MHFSTQIHCLSLLAEQFEAEDMSRLERFCLGYVHGSLPPWVYSVFQSQQAVALYKTLDQDSVRPLGLKHPLIKTTHKEVIKANRVELQHYLEPQQIALSSAGAAKLVMSVRAQLEARRDFFCMKLDLKNAYNEISRASIVEALQSEPTLQHLASFFGITLAPTTVLEAKGVVIGEAGDGEGQGDPKATAGFCVGLQPSLVAMDTTCRAAGGSAIGGADDIYVVGPAQVVLQAVAQFQLEVWERCHLRLQLDKSSLFSWEGDLPDDTPPEIQLAGCVTGDRFLRGFICYGCPVGEDEYVSVKLKEVADKILEDARKTTELLQQDKQALWSSLRLSISQRFDYWCQLAPPSLTRPVAEYLDRKLWAVLETALGFSVPRQGRPVGGEVDCMLNVPVVGLQAQPFAEWVVRQPVRLHGMGFRSQEDNCDPGYIGAFLQAAPFMATLPALKEVMGGEDTWGEDANPAYRLAPFLSSNQREAAELKGAWRRLQQEAEEAARYLGEEVEGPLASQLEEVALVDESCSRQNIVEAREQIRGKLLLLALERHPDRTARPVWSWPERDKHTSIWLLCLPLPHSTFSAQEFSTAAAALLCIPPPCCASHIGKAVQGRVQVCRWGDNVVNSTMQGDGWRTRHDGMKLLLRDLHVRAGLPIVCEVFNLFSDCIPQDGLNRMERGRRRQALVPDFKVRGDGGEGDVLCELKFINACKSRYPRDPRPRNGVRAVERRADGLTEVYGKTAREVDWRFCGTPRPLPAQPGVARPPRQIGPVEARLNTFGRVRGWVFGAWGETSEEVHSLVQKLAEARVRVADTLPGQCLRSKSKAALMASEVGFLRRRLSFAAVQGQARLLLDRLQLLGDGAREAAGRRDRALAARREEANEMRAQHAKMLQGRNICRKGFGLPE